VARTVRMPTPEDLDAARRAVRAVLAPTPVAAAPNLGERTVLKLETLQPTGSFKVRGGLAALAAAAAAGDAVVTASAGNHGLGVAYAANRLGVDATVVVAEDASLTKVEGLRAHRITLVQHGHGYDEAEAHALAIAQSEARRFVSPYNDPHTIAGQATLVDELREQVDDLARVVVPVGGGGLISGIALALSSQPRVTIAGVVPAASPAMLHAYRTGSLERVAVEPTLADGLAGNLEPGAITVAIARQRVASMVAVTEDQIADAIRALAFDHGIVAEGSGAVGVAAVRAGLLEPSTPAAGTTAVLVTGRNIDRATLASILAG